METIGNRFSQSSYRVSSLITVFTQSLSRWREVSTTHSLVLMKYFHCFGLSLGPDGRCCLGLDLGLSTTVSVLCLETKTVQEIWRLMRWINSDSLSVPFIKIVEYFSTTVLSGWVGQFLTMTIFTHRRYTKSCSNFLKNVAWSLMLTLSKIYYWVCRWNSFENWSAFWRSYIHTRT